MTHPTIDRIEELLTVDTLSGEIRWRKGQGRAAAGAVAGRIHRAGYREVCIDRRQCKAHAIVYFVAYGDWPLRIDHINGVRADNRIANLRAADAATNARNRTNWRHSKLLGAHLRPDGRYTACITADAIAYHLGVYATEQEAHERYVEARCACEAAEREARTAVLARMAAATPKAVEMAARTTERIAA